MSISIRRTHPDISEIIPGKLYLGSQSSARAHKKLRGLGVTHILNVTREVSYAQKRNFTYLRIDIEDGNERIGNHFHEAIRFIEKGKVVLVHCKKGISRSSSIVAAYLMKKNAWNSSEALQFVKSKRSVINPHFYFQTALVNFQEKIKGNNKQRRRTRLKKGNLIKI